MSTNAATVNKGSSKMFIKHSQYFRPSANGFLARLISFLRSRRKACFLKLHVAYPVQTLTRAAFFHPERNREQYGNP
jgi:hypothetical protein